MEAVDHLSCQNRY